jgi:hypothetical protein
MFAAGNVDRLVICRGPLRPAFSLQGTNGLECISTRYGMSGEQSGNNLATTRVACCLFGRFWPQNCWPRVPRTSIVAEIHQDTALWSAEIGSCLTDALAQPMTAQRYQNLRLRPVDGGQRSQTAWMTTVGSISETHLCILSYIDISLLAQRPSCRALVGSMRQDIFSKARISINEAKDGDQGQ